MNDIREEFQTIVPFLDGVSDANHIRGVGRALGRSEEEIEAGLEKRSKNWAYFELALNKRKIHAPQETVEIPSHLERPDYEFELAVLLDEPTEAGWGEEEAESFLKDHARVTILNDLSCRDLQRQDNELGLGPARSKTVLGKVFGPEFISYEEFTKTNPNLTLTVNGDVRKDGPAYTDATIWNFPQILSYLSSQSVIFEPGTVIGSGTFSDGSIGETGGEFPWLCENRSQEVVEMEAEGIGTLKNTFVRV